MFKCMHNGMAAEYQLSGTLILAVEEFALDWKMVSVSMFQDGHKLLVLNSLLVQLLIQILTLTFS